MLIEDRAEQNRIVSAAHKTDTVKPTVAHDNEAFLHGANKVPSEAGQNKVYAGGEGADHDDGEMEGSQRKDGESTSANPGRSFLCVKAKMATEHVDRTKQLPKSPGKKLCQGTFWPSLDY
ncbi:uncharacterized protein SPSK_10921 [Sporothrix schenckii 1099-18]|uniref:Uncharacterized protein n=1 Tax=Sporothrix schenckii 1099-18 TaxID=1397361 RepID=A0A0F2MBX6_SPOSC|nr:uncharacterized protein SPSK_10921 [Sporothrix schenckii 1099-18]KJR85661.1 hypothetical protein SPSK_10921 [Sporothrix schenckii 1099-18]